MQTELDLIRRNTNHGGQPLGDLLWWELAAASVNRPDLVKLWVQGGLPTELLPEEPTAEKAFKTAARETQVGRRVAQGVGFEGLDAAQLGACIDSRSTEAEVDRSLAEGRALRVNQTPSLFINGRPLPGNFPWEQLKTFIDLELQRAKTTGEEVEKCCQISLPVPGKH